MQKIISALKPVQPASIALQAAIAVTMAATAQATAYLDRIPGPDDTGGMLMPLVSLNFTTHTVSVEMNQSRTSTMYPLQQYNVWGTYPYANTVFDPALSSTPWYDLLDPSRQHLPFSTRFGFEIVSGNANQIPAGAYVYIKASEISSGLKLYDVGYWADIWQQGGGTEDWIQAFGDGNFGGTLSPELDNVMAWGDASSIKMWHPVALVPSPGLYSARFEIYLGDAYASALEGWSSASITLNWQAAAVPEPAAIALLLAIAGAGIAFTRRSSRARNGKVAA